MLSLEDAQTYVRFYQGFLIILKSSVVQCTDVGTYVNETLEVGALFYQFSSLHFYVMFTLRWNVLTNFKSRRQLVKLSTLFKVYCTRVTFLKVRAVKLPHDNLSNVTNGFESTLQYIIFREINSTCFNYPVILIYSYREPINTCNCPCRAPPLRKLFNGVLL